MKSHLSHIMPVWKACEILGEPTVMRIGTSLLRLRETANSTLKQQQSPKDDAVIEQEMQTLTAALFYRPPVQHAVDPLEDPMGIAQQEPTVPTHIAASWKRWLSAKALQLDKATLLPFLVPHAVQPASAGHMGLFDCLVYALQGHAVSSTATYYGGSNSNTIWIPDVLIFLAVCKQYSEYRRAVTARNSLRHDSNDNEEELDASARSVVNVRDQKVIWTMAVLTYRIYDSYLKKGTVVRDTVHRFMTDIYGDDSYKRPNAAALLDAMFYSGEESLTNPLQAVATEQQFCKRCLDTVRPDTGSHLLLDWVAVLGNAMMPLERIPASITAYLEAMNSTRPPLCQVYDLADTRLYEIKRRFHSLVQQQGVAGSSPLIQGDPMTGSSAAPDTAPMDPSNSAAGPNNSSRQAITEAAFCHGVNAANEELGTGGYLPVELAALVFRSGCQSGGTTAVPGLSQTGWGLYQVMHFGCIAVRHDTARNEDPDLPLLRFLFGMFQLTEADDYSCDYDTDKHILTRPQVANMLLRLMEYAEFRRRADSPPLDLDDDDDETARKEADHDAGDIEERKVSLATAVVLGLMQPPERSKPADLIALRTVVDNTMNRTAVADQMSFEDFCFWNRTSDDTSKKRGRGRLYPLMMELRLIAGVKFGIPPTLASMEVALVAEIDRRHKKRYPQSDVSRRGPRGTVWYIIDAAWFKSWATLVNKVAGTAEDPSDGRGDPRNDRVRGLVRISNTGLLVENGSLALRPDIRWKHDYELLPPLAWSALQAWYDGGPPIHRTVVKYVANSGAMSSPHSSRASMPTENEIELYPYFVTVYLCDAASRGEARPFQQNYQMSRVSPIIVLLVQLCKELDVSPDSARLWVMGSPSGARAVGSDVVDDGRGGEDWILSSDMNIVEQRKRRGVSKDGRITLLLELKDRDTGLWPRGADGKEWAFRDGSSPVQIPTDLGDGVVGLYNMGNTCYLNSSIQCLSHTPILREYFTSKAFYKDINRTNPLGHEGRLAQVSAVLINELWKRSHQSTPHQPKRVTAPGSYSPLTNAPALTPKTFKESLGKFNDIFAGNEQHDAQELLAFLLGGLSEDLNRIVEKPYMEAPDSDGRPDSELADIWWSNHLKREMSIIVALFTGQYKSLLTCRTCKYESARFEPFSFLQLPLPEDEHLSVTLTFYSAKEGVCPMKYCVRVRNDGTLRDVLVALAKLLHQDEIDDNDGDSFDAQEEANLSAAESKDETDDVYVQRARNMTVVVMREGYIARMAASNWLLQDQQNKESGELPLLHVYELDPIPENAQAIEPKAVDPASETEVQPEPTGDDNNVESDSNTAEERVEPNQPSPAFVAVGQRRSELVSRDFLHPLAHRVFGTPLLLRINDIDNFTGRDLYDLVAKRLKSVVPRSALRFLATQTDTSTDERKLPSNGDFESAQGEAKVGHHESAFRTTTDMEEVAAGHVPRYGFRIRLTTRDGRRCLRCAWYECCIGCLVPDDDDPTIVGDGDSIVVDWHFAVDVATNGFGFRVSGGDSIFSSQPVTTRIRPPAVTVKSHSSCGTGPKKGKQPGAVTLEECLDAFAKEEKIPEAYCSKCKDFRVQTKRMSLWRLPPVMIIHLKRFQFTQTMRRKLRDLVVFPTEGLDLSRIIAPDSVGVSGAEKENGTKGIIGLASDELKDDGRSEMLYDLYGVIHHQGALSGGHYVASLKSEIDGQWRLFNDAQIYEIHARDVVDPSAYILFYIRRDVAKAQLSDYWDVQDGNSLSDEDMDQLLKGRSDRCLIS